MPLLERAKFLAISSQNLDEFFQVRVAGLKDQVAAGVGAPVPMGAPPASSSSTSVTGSTSWYRLRAAFLDQVARRWPRRASSCRRGPTSTRTTRSSGRDVRGAHLPGVDAAGGRPGHPFPYISNLSLNLAVIVRDADRRFARVKVPSLLPRFVVLPDGERYVPSSRSWPCLDQLFPGMEIEQHHAFRVTRNTDLTAEEEEADDLLAMVEVEPAAPPVRAGGAPGDRRRHVGRGARAAWRELDVADEDVYVHRAPRPGWPVVGARARPARPQGPAVPAGHAHAAGQRRRRAGRRVRRHPPRRRAGAAPLRASAPRSRSSCARPRPTGRSWPSR